MISYLIIPFLEILVLFFLGIAVCIVVIPFKQIKLPIQLSVTQSLYWKSVQWIKENNYDSNIIYYYDPFCPHALDVDPFDRNKVREAHVELDREYPDRNIPGSGILIWDAHFGPNEGRMPLETLLNNKNLKLLKIFEPENKFNVLGGYEYRIYIFQKTINN